jgi:hypothetical protein
MVQFLYIHEMAGDVMFKSRPATHETYELLAELWKQFTPNQIGRIQEVLMTT